MSIRKPCARTGCTREALPRWNGKYWQARKYCSPECLQRFNRARDNETAKRRRAEAKAVRA